MDTLQDRIAACLSRHPDWDDKHVCNSIAGAHVAEVRAVRAGAPTTPAPDTNQPASPVEVSLDHIRERLDVAAAIRREISRVRRGRLLPEDELCRLTSGRDRNRFRRAVDNNPDLARVHRVKLRLDDQSEGRYYWGSAADIAEANRLKEL